MKRHKKELIGLYIILTTISTILTLTKNQNTWLVFLPFFIAGFGLFHVLSENKKKISSSPKKIVSILEKEADNEKLDCKTLDDKAIKRLQNISNNSD